MESKESEADIEIRAMSRSEVDIAIDWARQEGWNPGINDAEAFWSADPSGFFVALCDASPVGCISAVAYDENFAFGGFYIVKREFRSRGIGMRLWKHALEYLKGRTMGGDGVMERLSDYAREGFELAYCNVRFEGHALPKSFEPATEVASMPFTRLCEYDARFFPARRERFLEKWIEQPESLSLCVVKDGKIAGYGVIRKCFSGRKIGPLFADSPQIAEQLLRALTSPYSGEIFYLDVPEPNKAGLLMAERWNMKAVFKTGRIYNGEAPKLPLEGIFGVTTFELG